MLFRLGALSARWPGRRAGVAMTTAAALAAGGAVSVAMGAIPSGSDGVIHSCYQRPGLLANPGAVRVIDKEQGQSCRWNETALAWNQKGAKGDTGPQGPTGENGDPCLPNDPACVGPQGDKGDKGDPCLATEPPASVPRASPGPRDATATTATRAARDIHGNVRRDQRADRSGSRQPVHEGGLDDAARGELGDRCHREHQRQSVQRGQ